MNRISKVNSGKSTFLQEATPYIDGKGKTVFKNVRIGRVDSLTGRPEFDEDYLKKLKREGLPVPEVKPGPEFSSKNASKPSIAYCGIYFLLKKAAEKYGLLDTLLKALPSSGERFFNLLCSMIATYDTMHEYDTLYIQTDTGPKIFNAKELSGTINGITDGERNRLTSSWKKRLSEKDTTVHILRKSYLYSSLMGIRREGYLPDTDKISSCTFFGAKSGLPLYSVMYKRDLSSDNDVMRTIQTSEKAAATQIKMVVCNFTFLSNLRTSISSWLHAGWDESGYVTYYPISFISPSSHEEDDEFDSEAEIKLVEGTVRAKHFKTKYYGESDVFVYECPAHVESARSELISDLRDLICKAKINPYNERYRELFQKFLIIRDDPCSHKGFTVTINNTAVEEALEEEGRDGIAYFGAENAEEVIKLVRDNDMATRWFERFKNCLSLHRISKETNSSEENKMALCFFALILAFCLDRMLRAAGLDCTAEEAINIMSSARFSVEKGAAIDPTDRQQLILKAIGMQA